MTPASSCDGAGEFPSQIEPPHPASERSRTRRQDACVVLGGAWRRGKIRGGRQHDLVDRDPVFPPLYANRLRSRAREIDDRPEHPGTIAVVLPSPPGHAATATIFENDRRPLCGADAEHRL